MDKYKLYGYMADHLNIHRSTNDWYLGDCPFCAAKGKKRILRMHFEYNYVNCMSISCHWNVGSKFVYLAMELESIDYMDAKHLLLTYEPGSSGSLNSGTMVNALASMGGAEQFSKVALPYGFKTIKEGDGIIAKRAREYCTGRGFDIELIDSMGIGYCDSSEPGGDYNLDFFGYLIIPFHIQGKLVYYIGRDFLGGSRARYKNLPVEELEISKESLIYNEDVLQTHDEVFLLEGWADVLTIGNAIGLAGGLTLSDSQVFKIINSPCSKVIIGLDDGVYSEALRIANQLIEHKEVHVLKLEGGDPNSLGLQEVLEIYEDSEPMGWGDIMRELNDL